MENHGIYEKLSAIQQELKAPKGQYNSFGKYKYRSCEDILEAVKPICAKHKTALVLLDDIREVSGRFYVVAQAQLHDCESDNAVTATAFAREPDEKKGMDDSQITGTASSYARKYALNGLFCIDDTKDADTDEYKQQEKKPSKEEMDAFNKQYKREVEKNTCKDCGMPIYPVTHGGKTYSVAEIAENARKTYKAPLCWACMMARRKANESPTA
jgi:hypothetical protein